MSNQYKFGEMTMGAAHFGRQAGAELVSSLARRAVRYMSLWEQCNFSGSKIASQGPSSCNQVSGRPLSHEKYSNEVLIPQNSLLPCEASEQAGRVPASAPHRLHFGVKTVDQFGKR